MHKRWIWVGTATVVATVLALAWCWHAAPLRGADPATDAATLPAPWPAAVQHSPAAKPEGPPASAAPRAQQPAAWRSRLNAGADLKRLALDAMQHPEGGGIFYALMAAQLCGDGGVTGPQMQQAVVAASQALVRQYGTLRPEQQRQLEGYRDRCAGFAPGEAQTLAARLLADPTLARDPLASALNQWEAVREGGSRPARKAALQALLDTGDAMVYDAAGLLGNPSRTAYFEGRPVDTLSAESPWRMAASYAFCDRDTPSGMDVVAVMVCLDARNPLCEPDRDAFVRGTIDSASDSEADRQAVRAAIDRIRDAARRRDADAFLPPR